MAHRASQTFWKLDEQLPVKTRALADKKFALLKQDPRHPSLHFKKMGRFWSVRIGDHYRAIATEEGKDFHWRWIGSHEEYNNLTS